MPASWITKSDASEVRLAHPADGSGEKVYDLVNDVRFQNPKKDKVAEALKRAIQEDLTKRIPLRDFPNEDPAKIADPAATHGERMFWQGNGPNQELISRSTIVSEVYWGGTRFAIRLRRAVRWL